MEFIEAKKNPNSILKMLSKKVEERSPKYEGKRNKKAEIREAHSPASASLARPCHIAGRPVVLGHRCTVVRPVARPCLACFARVVRHFALLGARGFLDPLIFLERTFKVLFSIETR